MIDDPDSRDHGKMYLITELSATQAEAWATRLLLAMGKSGVEVPEGIFEMGMLGIAIMGIRSLAVVPWEVARPLLEEMMTCVQIMPDSRNHAVKRTLIEDDIEEVKTRIKLRDAIMELHTGFSVAAHLSKLKTSQAARSNGQDTGTSAQSLDELSPVA